MAVNYTEEQTAEIRNIYVSNPCRATVNELAERFGKSPKSIIGKLSKEGVYIREAYKTKMDTDPVTKAELVLDICEALEVDGLLGLEKAPKGTLMKLKELVARLE